MGQPAEPTPSPTHAPTVLVDQHALNADRTEIFVLFIGIIFLVSQLALVTWLFARSSARKESPQRNIARTAPGRKHPLSPDDNEDNDDVIEDRQVRQQGFRRSSTWNGRSRLAAQDGRLLRRRRRSSGLEMTDLRIPLPSPEKNSDYSSKQGIVRSGFRDVGMMAAALATPMVSQSPRRLRSPLCSPGTESDSSSGNGRVWELGHIPARLSPRSPRVVPIDQATISAILRGEIDRGEDADAPPISLAAAEDGKELVAGFDDPLGVNRRGTGLRAGDACSDNETPLGRRYSDTL